MAIIAMTASASLLFLGSLAVLFVLGLVARQKLKSLKEERLNFDPSCRYCKDPWPENYGCCSYCAEHVAPICTQPCTGELKCPACQLKYEAAHKDGTICRDCGDPDPEHYGICEDCIWQDNMICDNPCTSRTKGGKCPECTRQDQGLAPRPVPKCTMCGEGEGEYGRICTPCSESIAVRFGNLRLSENTNMLSSMSTYNNGRFGELQIDEEWQRTLGNMGSIAADRQRLIMEEHARAEAMRQANERLNPQPQQPVFQETPKVTRILDEIKKKVDDKIEKKEENPKFVKGKRRIKV